jgi:predicted membrane-bound dolichyl-phosphate-mannose-protein mannosyltransferase
MNSDEENALEEQLSQQNLVWDLMRIIMPALVFVVIFLALALIADMNFWLAGGIAFAVALGDYFLFAYLKKRTGS